MSAEIPYFAARLLLGVLCAWVAGVALRGLRPAPTQWGRIGLAVLMVVTALLSAVDAALTLDEGYPVALTGMSWAWLGVDLAVPLLALHVLRVMEERDAAMDALLELAATDPLTGLPNRRGFGARAAAALAQAGRAGQPSAVLALDLDRFKLINDAHGHPAGDAVLVALADVLRGAVRAQDVAGRLGGEEFALLLPGTSAEEAAAIAARLLAAVPAGVPHPAGGEARVTTSIGLAMVPKGRPARALTVALGRADRALYAAKRNGRNRVEAA